MKYMIIYQDHDDGTPGVVSAYRADAKVGGQVGAIREPVDVELTDAKRLIEIALRDGYRPTGDTTREILAIR